MKLSTERKLKMLPIESPDAMLPVAKRARMAPALIVDSVLQNDMRE